MFSIFNILYFAIEQSQPKIERDYALKGLQK